MRFQGLDLNLLVALDALLTTRSITRAAERLHLSQPAVSAALTRLREFFGDDLLVLHGKKFFATAAAESLHPLVQAWLRDAGAIIATSQGFDPATSQRMFRIIASDYTSTVILTRLTETLSRTAPGVIIDIIPPHDQALRELQDMSVDLVLGPEDFALPGHPTHTLFEEGFVVAGWSQNPLFDRSITKRDFLAAGHVVVTFGPKRSAAYGDRYLESRGISRRVEVRTSSFAALPWFLNGTQRLAIMFERLARFFEGVAPLSHAPLPFPIPPLRVVAQYHQARRQDAGLAWLITAMKEAAAAA